MPERTAESPETAEAEPPLRMEAQATVAGAVLALQRSAGNRAVRSLLRDRRRLDRAPSLPAFTQRGDSCGAASLVTAFFLWDAERGSTDNRAVVHACDLALTEGELYSRDASGRAEVADVRAVASKPGAKLGQKEYGDLGDGLAKMYNGYRGMKSEDISKLAAAVGLRAQGSANGNTLRDILVSDEVRDLAAGDVGQLHWPLARLVAHVMLLGRHEDGTWFFSDQGQSPPRRIQTATHADLVSSILFYQSTEDALYRGERKDFLSPPTMAFVPMGHIQAFLNRGPEALLKPGEKLAEIDAGWGSTGEVLTTWDYHSAWGTIAAAKDAIGKDTGPHGGVIIERPLDTFHIWKTNPIRDADNLKQTDIDRDDSGDMVLMKRRKFFHSVWLVLSDPSGKKSPPFAVS